MEKFVDCILLILTIFSLTFIILKLFTNKCFGIVKGGKIEFLIMVLLIVFLSVCLLYMTLKFYIDYTSVLFWVALFSISFTICYLFLYGLLFLASKIYKEDSFE